MFRWWRNNSRANESSVDAAEIGVHVDHAGSEPVVRVSGRVTIDSSPHLRSVLQRLLRKKAPPVIRIDLSEVSYLDTSGIATLLEALRIANGHSTKLSVTGVHGQAGMLAEIVELAKIFAASGSEVAFQ